MYLYLRQIYISCMREVGKIKWCCFWEKKEGGEYSYGVRLEKWRRNLMEDIIKEGKVFIKWVQVDAFIQK